MWAEVGEMMLMRQNGRFARGAAILSLLLSLVIIFILMGMFFGPVSTGPGAPRGSKPFAIQMLDRTRISVCEANRRTMITTMFQDELTYGRMQTNEPAQMIETAKKFSACPGEGKLYMCDGEIFCTQHVPTGRFRERLQLF